MLYFRPAGSPIFAAASKSISFHRPSAFGPSATATAAGASGAAGAGAERCAPPLLAVSLGHNRTMCLRQHTVPMVALATGGGHGNGALAAADADEDGEALSLEAGHGNGALDPRVTLLAHMLAAEAEMRGTRVVPRQASRLVSVILARAQPSVTMLVGKQHSKRQGHQPRVIAPLSVEGRRAIRSEPGARNARGGSEVWIVVR